MIISRTMNLTELAQHMGREAEITSAEAMAMRDLLVASGYSDTNDMEDGEFLAMTEEAVSENA